MYIKKLLMAVLFIFSMNVLPSYADNAMATFESLSNAGLLVLNKQGQAKISKAADQAFIPASTTKLVTAWLALKHWGANYRFETDFYYDQAQQILWVKGKGDPFLVSEELLIIVQQLKQKGLSKINAIAVDDSYFAANLVLPGTGRTNNPYDAVPSALAANFNSVYLKRVNGELKSAEAQTPLTAYAKSLGGQMHQSKIRVNTGPAPRDAELNFAQLLAAFLRKQGVDVEPKIMFGAVPGLPLFYQHKNSRTLAEMVQPMLKYSTNFVANQLILMLSAEAYGTPVESWQVERYMQQTLSEYFHWHDFILQDGAGLSRNNRLTAQQLVDVLLAFLSWKQLLPEIEPGVFAKTGTLKQVSTLAGYLVIDQSWEPFALMINEAVSPGFRNQLAEELINIQTKR